MAPVRKDGGFFACVGRGGDFLKANVEIVTIGWYNRKANAVPAAAGPQNKERGPEG